MHCQKEVMFNLTTISGSQQFLMWVSHILKSDWRGTTPLVLICLWDTALCIQANEIYNLNRDLSGNQMSSSLFSSAHREFFIGTNLWRQFTLKSISFSLNVEGEMLFHTINHFSFCQNLPFTVYVGTVYRSIHLNQPSRIILLAWHFYLRRYSCDLYLLVPKCLHS